MISSTDCDVCCARRCTFSYNKCGMAMVYLLMVISNWIAGHALSPFGYQPDAAQCTRSLKRRLHHVNLPVMSTYKALFENGSCWKMGRAARLQQEASAAPLRVPEG